MTRITEIKSLFKTMLIVLFVMAASSESIAQEKNIDDLKAFKITIKRTDNGLKMYSHNGSAWIDLSFKLPNYKPQAIDEYGMTQLGKVSTDKDPNLVDYLFTITITKDGVILTGIEGTAWKELSFPFEKGGKQTIDQFGMIE